MNIFEMFGMRVQHKLRIDGGVIKSDKPDSVVLIPAPIGGGSRIEVDGVVDPLDLRDVTVPVDNEIDPILENLAR